MVDTDTDPSSERHFRYVLNPKESSLKQSHALHPDRFDASAYTVGTTIERSMSVERVMHDLLDRMTQTERSLALICDYGHARPGKNSLRVS